MKLKDLIRPEEDKAKKAAELIEKNYPNIIPKKSDVKPAPMPKAEMPKPDVAKITVILEGAKKNKNIQYIVWRETSPEEAADIDNITNIFRDMGLITPDSVVRMAANIEGSMTENGKCDVLLAISGKVDGEVRRKSMGSILWAEDYIEKFRE